MSEQFDQADIPEIGKSTLVNFDYRLVGFTYMEFVPDLVQITFFHQQSDAKQYILCMSTITKKQAKKFRKRLRSSLGNIVGWEEVIPYVQRGIGNCTFEQFKECVEAGFQEQQIEWWNGCV